MTNPEQVVARCRTAMVSRWPFVATQAAKLEWHVGRFSWCPTAGTDGKNLWVNLDYVEKLIEAKTLGLLVHEIKHVICGHHLRRPEWCPRDLWNVATDYIINADIMEEGFELPDGALYDPRYTGKDWSSEQLARHLLKLAEDELFDEPPPPPGGDGEECEDGDPGDDGENEDTEQEKEGEEKEGEEGESEEEGEEGKGDPEEPGEGEGPDDGKEKGEEGKPEEEGVQPGEGGTGGKGKGGDGPEGGDFPGPITQTTRLPKGVKLPEWGHVHDMTGEDGKPLTPQEKAEELIDHGVDINEGWIATQGFGGGGDMRRARAEREVHPDWKEVIKSRAQAVQNRRDYSWNKLSRRYAGQDVWLPSLVGESLGNIVVAVDTSGSIADEQLNLAAALTNSILEEFPGTTVHALYVDHMLRKVEVFEEHDMPVKFEVEGRGGTSFYPAFDWANEAAMSGLEITALVYITDLECSDPYYMPRPEYEVIWAFNGRSPWHKQYVRWGEIVDVNEVPC